MSRSYKKIPWTGDTKGKDKKRQANSKVRMFLKNLNHIIQNADYKKVYESWDVCDYGWVCEWDEYWERVLTLYEEHPNWFKYPPNKKEEYRKWYRTYKMK